VHVDADIARAVGNAQRQAQRIGGELANRSNQT
jgi:hypothetical protein